VYDNRPPWEQSGKWVPADTFPGSHFGGGLNLLPDKTLYAGAPGTGKVYITSVIESISPLPTAYPTTAPTTFPTTFPSTSFTPSEYPSVSPTLYPTSAPSMSPSNDPQNWLEITSPNSSTVWTAGASEMVTWISHLTDPTVRLRIFLNDSGAVGPHHTVWAGNESFPFTVPQSFGAALPKKYSLYIEIVNGSKSKFSDEFEIRRSDGGLNGSNGVGENKSGQLQLFEVIIIVVAAFVTIVAICVWKWRPVAYSLLTTSKSTRDVSPVASTAEIKVSPVAPDIESQMSMSRIDVGSDNSAGILLGTTLLDSKERVKYRWLIDRNDLRIDQGKVLGQGGYGVVRKGLWLDGSRQYDVAIKVLSKGAIGSTVEDELVKEADMMVSLRSPFIVQMYGMCQDSLGHLLVMELMGAGSLLGLLHAPEEEKRPSLALRVQLMQDVSRGLEVRACL
jgi:hypothetical protein